jgi:response regulator of citrate/malate metabolism
VSNEELHAEVSYGTVGRPERRYRRIDKEQEIDQ